MKQLLLIWLLLAGSIAVAQKTQRTSLGMSGTSAIIQNKYVSESVGQASVIGTFGNETITIRQGFQQPLIQVVNLPQTPQGLQVVVYPNPVDTSINIQFNEQIDTLITVSIYNVLGQLITTQSFQGIQKTTMDVTALASGNYLLKIDSEKQTFTAKLIKN